MRKYPSHFGNRAFSLALLAISPLFCLAQDPSPVAHTLHNFRGHDTDGAAPWASVVIGPCGVLYGTTHAGGKPSCQVGCGTVFELIPPALATSGHWTERVIHSFDLAVGDGWAPSANLGGSTGVQGAAMAIANAPGTGSATLWAIAADTITGGTWGWLYAYNMNVSTGVLTPWWNSTGTGIANCSDTSQKGWFATSFTEPTLANGAAYVPSACVVTGTISPSVQNCLQVPAANVASGVLVFSSCS